MQQRGVSLTLKHDSGYIFRHNIYHKLWPEYLYTDKTANSCNILSKFACYEYYENLFDC